MTQAIHLTPWRFAVLALGLAVLTAAGCATSDLPSDQHSPAAAQSYRDFGDPMQGDPRDTVDAAAVLASLDDYDGKPVRIRGVVDQVCPKRGCWMRVRGSEESGESGGAWDSGGQTIFVKFTCPIDGRLIPMEAVDQSTIVEGVLQRAQMSEAAARHYAEDAGATPEQIAAIQGPKPVLRMASASARVLGLPGDQAP